MAKLDDFHKSLFSQHFHCCLLLLLLLSVCIFHSAPFSSLSGTSCTHSSAPQRPQSFHGDSSSAEGAFSALLPSKALSTSLSPLPCDPALPHPYTSFQTGLFLFFPLNCDFVSLTLEQLQIWTMCNAFISLSPNSLYKETMWASSRDPAAVSTVNIFFTVNQIHSCSIIISANNKSNNV